MTYVAFSLVWSAWGLATGYLVAAYLPGGPRCYR